MPTMPSRNKVWSSTTRTRIVSVTSARLLSLAGRQRPANANGRPCPWARSDGQHTAHPGRAGAHDAHAEMQATVGAVLAPSISGKQAVNIKTAAVVINTQLA